MKKSIKNCGNCKNFCMHFCWRYDRFLILDLGHCRFKIKKNFQMASDKACANWQDAGDKKEMEVTDIKKVLKKMSERLEDISNYFSQE